MKVKSSASLFRFKSGITALLVLASLCCHTVNSQDNASGMKYRTIMVLAKIEQTEIKKQFEDAMVNALKQKGYNAIPSYANVTAEDLGSTEKFIARIDTLKVDALLAFTLLGVETRVVNTPADL